MVDDTIGRFRAAIDRVNKSSGKIAAAYDIAPSVLDTVVSWRHGRELVPLEI